MEKKKNKNLTSFGVERPALTTEQAKKYGSMGGKKKGENSRKRMSMRDAFSAIESLPATGKLDELLERMGIPEEERVGSVGIVATLYSLAMKGDKSAIKMWLDYVAQEAERERKDEESKARIAAMLNGDVSVSSDDEDSGRVQIYLPAIDSEESLSVEANLNKE